MDDKKNRVVVTGIGIISCIGNNISEVTDSLKNGRVGYDIDPVRIEMGFRSPLTGIIRNFDPKNYLDRKKRKTMSLSTIWAYVATEQAVGDSGLKPEEIESTETGVIFGHDSVSQPNVEMADDLRKFKETKSLGSGYIFQVMDSTVTMNLSTIFKTKGACWSLAAACASGAHSIGQAADLIRCGRQERVIAGGAQEINWHVMASFDALNAFSTNIEAPKSASRPFDKNRDGLVPSGGAAALVLERMDIAVKRGAKIYGEIAGYGFSADGADLSIPDGIGAQVAMSKALNTSGIRPEEIEYINAHATSTVGGDLKEADAINKIFGSDTYVSSTKSMTGHECWMAGASEAIYSLIMMNEGFIAPNVNFVEGDEVTGKLKIVNKTLKFAPKLVLSNSFGFGGTNAALILRKV